MKEKSLKKNAFYSELKVFLSLVFPLITFPYVSRILLPEGIGKVNFANTIVNYFVLISSLGIGGYANRETAKLKEDRKALSIFFKEIITINTFSCIIAYILFFIALYFIPKFSAYKTLLLICCINIPFSIFGIDWLYSANEEFRYLTIRSFIVQVICVIYLFIFVRTKEDIAFYALFGVLINIGNNIINFFVAGKFIDFKIKTRLKLKQHMKPIFVFWGITVITTIYSLFDTTMLGFLSTNTEVGYYTASTKFVHMILGMLTAITAVLLPRFTDLIKNNDKTNFNDLVNKSINILILLSIPITIGIILLSKSMILLLSGEQYLPSVSSMIIISPIIIIISFGSLIGGQLLPSLGKEKISLYSYIVGVTINITLNSILIPKYGAAGAAIGTVFAELSVTLFQSIYARKIIFHKNQIKTFIESLIASVIMGIIIFFILRFITNPLYQLLISFFTGILTYSFFLYIMKNEYFIFYLKKLLNFIKRK